MKNERAWAKSAAAANLKGAAGVKANAGVSPLRCASVEMTAVAVSVGRERFRRMRAVGMGRVG
jgi:hypothetical protein